MADEREGSLDEGSDDLLARLAAEVGDLLAGEYDDDREEPEGG